ncbi:hypothetical protein ABPG75_001455 [Micractinium tetrahymenae]
MLPGASPISAASGSNCWACCCCSGSASTSQMGQPQMHGEAEPEADEVAEPEVARSCRQLLEAACRAAHWAASQPQAVHALMPCEQFRDLLLKVLCHSVGVSGLRVGSGATREAQAASAAFDLAVQAVTSGSFEALSAHVCFHLALPVAHHAACGLVAVARSAASLSAVRSLAGRLVQDARLRHSWYIVMQDARSQPRLAAHLVTGGILTAMLEAVPAEGAEDSGASQGLQGAAPAEDAAGLLQLAMAAQLEHAELADAAPGTTIDALPNELLGMVLAAAGKQAWLRESLGAGGRGLEGVFALLNPAALRSLHLDWDSPLPPAAAQLLVSFTQLTDLSLEGREYSPGQAMQAADALRQLSRMERFPLWAWIVPPAIVEAASSLPMLRSLALTALNSLESGDAASLLCLTALQGLTFLNLSEGARGGGTLQPPSAVLFPHLQSFYCDSVRAHGEGCLKVGGCTMYSCQLARSESHTGFSDGRTFNRLVLEASLLPDMPALLAALLLPDISLEWLVIKHVQEVDAAALHGCTRLSQLSTLALDDCSAVPSLDAVIGALLQQAPAVTDLCLRHSLSAHSLPPTVAAFDGLKSLIMCDRRLSDLPHGPYLAGLESLDLSGCDNLARLPAVLADATSLHSLHLPFCEDRLLAMSDEMAGLLLGLPQLTFLGLVGGIPAELLARLKQARPELEIE